MACHLVLLKQEVPPANVSRWYKNSWLASAPAVFILGKRLGLNKSPAWLHTISLQISWCLNLHGPDCIMCLHICFHDLTTTIVAIVMVRSWQNESFLRLQHWSTFSTSHLAEIMSAQGLKPQFVLASLCLMIVFGIYQMYPDTKKWPKSFQWNPLF